MAEGAPSGSTTGSPTLAAQIKPVYARPTKKRPTRKAPKPPKKQEKA